LLKGTRRNATLLTDDILQRAFLLICALHTDRAVALCVLQDSFDFLAVTGRDQQRRSESDRAYKVRIPEESWLQFSVYRASELWEKDQEFAHPRKKPGYKPTGDDLRVRYVKTLVWKVMDRPSRYAAVAFGSLLHTYQPHEISALSEDVFSSDNIRRCKSTTFEQIELRFRHVSGLFNGRGQVALEVPTSHQRELIQSSLSRLAPWCSSCPATNGRAPVAPLLEAYFSRESSRTEWERTHVLCHPECGGLAKLVREYNFNLARGSEMCLDDPDDKLGSPKFGDLRGPDKDGGDGGPSDPGGRFSPSPLTYYELSSVKHSFERNQRRRRDFHSGRLRVYVDGEETAASTDGYLVEPFFIHRAASCIEIFGEDDEGELLLAVFPLANPESGEGATERASVTLEGGQTLKLSTSPAAGHVSVSRGSLARLEYIRPVDRVSVPAGAPHAHSPVRSDEDASEAGAYPSAGGSQMGREPQSHRELTAAARESLTGSGGRGAVYAERKAMPAAGKYVFITHHPEGEGREHAALLSWVLNRENIRTQLGEDFGGRRSSEALSGLTESASLIVPILTRDVKLGEDGSQSLHWIQREATLAFRRSVPFLFVIEDGTVFDGRIVGDIEQIRFAPGNFHSTIERVVQQVTALVHHLVVPRELPEGDLNDRVWRLIMEAREQARRANFEKFLRLSEEALAIEPRAWRAALNVGVALAKLGRLSDAERVFLDIIQAFNDNVQAKAMSYHNLGWIQHIRSAGEPGNTKSLTAEATYYEAALAVMHSKTHTRASLIQCRVLLGQLNEAKALLMESLNYRGFLEALRYETENRGHLGHQILRQLPGSEWLYPLLFPAWHAADDELREDNRLV
jgi:tetratricopeptide (TPR) repeat protein